MARTANKDLIGVRWCRRAASHATGYDEPIGRMIFDEASTVAESGRAARAHPVRAASSFTLCIYGSKSPATSASWASTQQRCEPDGKKPFALVLPAISSFKEGGATSLYFWNPQSRSFERIWTSD
jgi:hypothetical protein